MTRKVTQTFLSLLILGGGLRLLDSPRRHTKYRPTTPASRTLTAYKPPRAEVYAASRIQFADHFPAKTLEPFQLPVSIEQFQELAITSPYTALVFRGDINTTFEIEYDYWLSRGDGAWYHTRICLKEPDFGPSFHNEWHREDDFTWLVRPIYNGNISSIDLVAGGLMTAIGLCLILRLVLTTRMVQIQSRPI